MRHESVTTSTRHGASYEAKREYKVQEDSPLDYAQTGSKLET
jgi:hypothetical protein